MGPYLLIIYVKDAANLHGIKEESPQPCHHQQLPQRLKDVVLESSGVRAVVSPSLSDHYKRNIFLSYIQC